MKTKSYWKIKNWFICRREKSGNRNVGIHCEICEGDSFNTTIIVRRHNPSHIRVKQGLKQIRRAHNKGEGITLALYGRFKTDG
jgi:hypothetical protein